MTAVPMTTLKTFHHWLSTGEHLPQQMCQARSGVLMPHKSSCWAPITQHCLWHHLAPHEGSANKAKAPVRRIYIKEKLGSADVPTLPPALQLRISVFNDEKSSKKSRFFYNLLKNPCDFLLQRNLSLTWDGERERPWGNCAFPHPNLIMSSLGLSSFLHLKQKVLKDHFFT